MSRKLYLLLVTLLAGGLIAIGCGDDDDDDGGGSDEPAKEESSGGTSTKKDDGGDANVPTAAAKQAAENCKQSIEATPQLSAKVKDELNTVCEEAAQGDADAAREATKKVCITLVEESVPAGPAADQAKAACEKSTQ